MALLGKLLLDKGILTPEQLQEALQAQERLAAQGLEKLLGDLLIAKGFASPGQIREVLEEQQKQVVLCGACRTQFNVAKEDVGKVVSCPRCGRKLQVPAELKQLTLARPLEPTYIDAGAAPVAYVLVKSFEGEDEVYPIKEGDDLIAGSDEECLIHVEGEGVEPRHVRFLVTGGSLLLNDVSSAEGVYVNGRRVKKCALKFGDLVVLGRQPLMVSPGMPGSRDAIAGEETDRQHLIDVDPANLVGMTVGRYRFIRMLGAGGMSIVLLAEQIPLNRLVAVKVLRNEMIFNRKSADRFIREALAGAQLNHTNIVQVYDAGRLGGLFYIAMEYVEGEDVGMWIRRFGKLPVSLSLSIAIQVAIGLDFAHGKGVIHRDVKPSNVMFTKDGRVKLLDLGIARMRDDAAPETRKLGVGTLVYMPPEQTRDASSVDHRADIYALGVTIYKMITGVPPYKKKSVDEMIASIRSDPLPDPREVTPEVPESLAAVLAKAMAKKPEKRYQTVREFQAELVSIWNSLQ